MKLPALSPRRRTLVDLLLLALLCLLLFWRELPWAGVDYRGFAAGDFGNQFYAFAAYKAMRLHAGQLPLWSPYAFGGHPFLADIQSAVFYPPGLLTMLITRFTGFSYAALQVEAILHFPLVAAGTYLLARRLTGSRVGAWVAAVTFTFSSYLTGYALLQLAILETVAWLPWVLLALDHMVEALVGHANRAALRWSLIAGLLMGVALLAGHPQSAMFVFYGSVAFVLFRYFGSVPAPRPSLLALAGLLALFAIVAGGLAAAQLVPSLEYMRLSTRAGLGIDAAGTGFTPYDLLQFALPQIASPFAGLYVGVLPLGLAIAALWPSPTTGTARRRLALFFAALTLVSVLLSFGALTPLYQLAYLVVPGWRLFRQQERLAIWVVFGIAMLAGLAGARLQRGAVGASTPANDSAPSGGSPRLPRAYWIAAGLALLFTFACFVAYLGGNNALWGFTAAGLLLAAMLALAALALHSRRPVWLVLLIAFDLFTLTGRQHAGDAASAHVFPPGPVFDAVAADATASHAAGAGASGGAPFRVLDEDMLPGNYGYGYRLQDTNGASPLVLATYDKLRQEAPKPLFWRLMGVKYVFTWRQELEEPATRLAQQPAKDGKPAYAYRLTEDHPRAWLVGGVETPGDAAAQAAAVLREGFNPQAAVVLNHSPDPAPQPGCTGSLEWTAYTPEFLSLNVTTDAPCILVLSEIAYPGWQARVDGAASPVLTADAILRGVALPAGGHRVELTFRPVSVVVGLIASGVTLVAALIALLWLRARTQRRR